jgi:hypothetical protein
MWLQEKTGSRDFLQLDLVKDGFYHPWEALNLADGRRSLLDIRNALSAEYGPVPIEHVYAYFGMLETAGAVRWHDNA